MKMAKVNMPFDDFEDRMMAKIEKLEHEKTAIAKTRKYALISFLFGTLFGVGLNYIIADFVAATHMSTTLKSTLLSLSQIVYVILLIVFSDKVWKLMKVKLN